MVRVRFAPSPTGHLHIGGARTALFNWLFARKQKGAFILRIEDTDEARSTKESVDAILEGLAWLGIDWDEGPEKGGEFGPYFQMQRLSIYEKYAQTLLNEGNAYYCYCQPDELDRMRKKALSEGKPPRYDGRCRLLSETERERLEKEGKSKVLRVKTPDEGITDFTDIVRGKVEFQNVLLEDFVIIKSSGAPAFNFANVVDDHKMRITHIIRGDEHLSNTPRQVILYGLLGFEIPVFAHLSMILNKSGAKLSKRDGAVSLGWYRDEGYLPEALMNYLALLGWGTEDSQQVFETAGEITEKFSLEKVGKSPAIFDTDKLNWLNGVFIRKLDEAELFKLALPYLEKEGLVRAEEDMERVKGIILLERERLKTLSEIAGLTDFFFKDEIEIDENAKKILAKDGVADILKKFRGSFSDLEEFNLKSIEDMTRGLIGELGIKGKELMQPVRAAITGRTATPGLFDVLFFLGKERALRRLDDCLTRL